MNVETIILSWLGANTLAIVTLFILFKRLVNDLEKDDKDMYPINREGFDRKQFLKDCGVE